MRRSPEKLLYVMNHYATTGATHFAHVVPLLNELARQGVTVRLVVEKSDGVPAGIGPGVECVRLPTGINPLRRMMHLARQVRRAANDGYDVIFVRIAVWSALAAILGSRMTRARVWFWQSGTTIEFDRVQPWTGRKVRWWLTSRVPARLVWWLCDYFVTGPEPMLEYYRAHGVAGRKLRLLYNDVELSRFEWDAVARQKLRSQLRQELGLAPDTVVLLFVHRMSPVRRTLDYLPSAVLEARAHGVWNNAALLIAGGGADEPRLRHLCESSGLSTHVHFLGERANLGIEQLYGGSDIFLQPTHAEGFPRVLLEAMAAGLPTVTTDAGGSGHLLGALQQQFVVDADRPAEFGEALCRMLCSRDEWQDLSRENLERVGRFSTPVVAGMYREVLFSG